MGQNSSIALPESQATLHCASKAILYAVEMSLGKRIKAARIRLKPKVTQPQIAAAFNVTVQTVSNWERGENDPDLDKVAKLARILKVPAIWLLEGKGSPPPPDALESVVDRLDPEQRALLEAMAQTMLQRRESAA
jgi:transcriptional regulator with XRE-family HTH domain